MGWANPLPSSCNAAVSEVSRSQACGWTGARAAPLQDFPMAPERGTETLQLRPAPSQLPSPGKALLQSGNSRADLPGAVTAAGPCFLHAVHSRHTQPQAKSGMGLS